MTPTAPPDSGPLTTDVELQRWLDELLRGATRPQLWLIFLDDEARVVPPLMPCGDLPPDPYMPTPTDDLGVLPVVSVLAARVGALVELLGAAQAVLVWERPGTARLSPIDRGWASGMARACSEAGVPLRAQCLLHDGGSIVLAADDSAPGLTTRRA